MRRSVKQNSACVVCRGAGLWQPSVSCLVRIIKFASRQHAILNASAVLRAMEGANLARDLPRHFGEDSRPTLSKFFFFRAQRGTAIHNVRVVTMNFVPKSFVTTTCQNPFGASWGTQ